MSSNSKKAYKSKTNTRTELNVEEEEAEAKLEIVIVVVTWAAMENIYLCMYVCVYEAQRIIVKYNMQLGSLKTCRTSNTMVIKIHLSMRGRKSATNNNNSNNISNTNNKQHMLRRAYASTLVCVLKWICTCAGAYTTESAAAEYEETKAKQNGLLQQQP